MNFTDIGQMTDVELAAASVADPGVFGEIVDRHYDLVYRYLARRVERATAEDLCSETFLVAFRRRESVRADAQSLAPWLLGIATNQLRRHRRDEARRLRAYSKVANESAAAAADVFERADDRMSSEGTLGDLLAALAKLPTSQRDVVHLIGFENLSYESAAMALDVPVGTVRSRLNRARKKLHLDLDPGTRAAPDAERPTR
jgi:RNA polymerase sigma factor (sigma-70 family)